MKKKLLPLLLASSLAIFSTTGCLSTSSTTSAGNVGADRNQLMLFTEEEVTASAANYYTEVIDEAKQAGTLLADNNATTKRVRAIGNKLIAQTGAFREDAKNWKWEVNVIKEDTVNAWCMAGGKIVVYTGIIDALKLTDGELAAVMGHEISHALREHSREQASRSSLTQLGTSALSQIAGFGTLGTTAVELVAQYALTLPFSRSQETEADNIGTELMARAGYDPHEAVKVWEKMSALTQSSTPEILSTHPSNENRIKNLTVISEKVYPLYQESSK